MSGKSTMVDDILSIERANEKRNQMIEMNCELTADNYASFDDEFNRRFLGREYVQSDPLKGLRRTFQLYRDTYLFQMMDRYRRSEHRKYRISLACLSAKPEQHVVLEWKWISTAIATAIWSAVLIYLGYFTDLFTHTGALQPVHAISAGILMATITVISLLLFLYYREDKTVFTSFQADVPLVELETNKPDEATFNALKDEIIAGISSARMYQDTQEILISELQELRRLRDEGAVDPLVYEKARASIFSHYEFREGVREEVIVFEEEEAAEEVHVDDVLQQAQEDEQLTLAEPEDDADSDSIRFY